MAQIFLFCHFLKSHFSWINRCRTFYILTVYVLTSLGSGKAFFLKNRCFGARLSHCKYWSLLYFLVLEPLIWSRGQKPVESHFTTDFPELENAWTGVEQDSNEPILWMETTAEETCKKLQSVRLLIFVRNFLDYSNKLAWCSIRLEIIVAKLQENDSMGRGSANKAKEIRLKVQKRVPFDLDRQRQEKTQVRKMIEVTFAFIFKEYDFAI